MKPLRLAGIALLSVTLSARAYVLILNDTGFAQHWDLVMPQSFVSTNVVNTNTHAIRFFLASDGYSATNTAAELNALRAAFGQWQSIPGTSLKFEDAGLLAPQTDVNNEDGKNIIFWTRTNQYLVNDQLDSMQGALGVTYSSATVDDNTLVEADIVLNGADRAWFTDFGDPANPNVFVESVALHEIGHFIGLEHSPVGGATMLYHGSPGVNVQAGLSPDDVAAARFLYATTRTDFGAIKGTITKSGNPVFGAQVFAENPVGNLIAGTVALADGTYELNMLPPGTYQVRVTPLDPAVNTRLVAAPDIGYEFIGSDTAFLPTTNVTVMVSANSTNAVDFEVANDTPAFRIAAIARPNTSPSNPSFAFSPVALRVGQSNFFVGVGSASMPSNNASLTVAGDGLTLGTPVFKTNYALNMNFILVPISVASNATPGLRSFLVTQGANAAYANGFLEIMAAVSDYNFDGLEDTFQRQYFPLFTAAIAAPGADPDGDGMNNFAESIAGTVPTNSTSLLKMQSVARTNTTATVRWSSVGGKKYQVAYRTNLAAGAWSSLGPVVAASAATTLLADPTATNAFRFYRVQVLP